jgi:pectinesterase inhibitor-like protein
MAMFSTIVSFFVVLFIATSASLVHSDGSNENVRKSCIGTPFPETCISTLSRFNESKDADPRSMAGLMVWLTSPTINSAAFIAGVQTLDHEDLSHEDASCFTSCRDEMRNASEKLDAAFGEPGSDIAKVKLADVHKFFEEAKAKHIVWNCDRCRHGEMKKTVDEISPGNEAEKRMAILDVLVDRAMK